MLGEIGAGRRVEYAAFGDTVNIAARLQSAAEPGRVLVDDATPPAGRGRCSTGASRATLELKGKAEPVAATAVTARRPSARRPRGLGACRARWSAATAS